jgi:hypothetical protein
VVACCYAPCQRISQSASIEGVYYPSHENFESIQRLFLIGPLSPSERETASQYRYQFSLRDARMALPHSIRAYAGDHVCHSDASSYFLIRFEATRQARIDPLQPLLW